MINWYDRGISRDLRRGLLTKKYFYKRGHRPAKFDWLSLYKAIADFKLIFRLSFELHSGKIKPQYVAKTAR